MGSQPYDLEERTFQFAKACRQFVKKLKWSIANQEDSKQLINASGSVGGNYIEANEGVSKADFQYRIKICKKEAKEAKYWLRLLETNTDKTLDEERKGLINEADELMRIFAAILRNSARLQES